MTRVGFFAGSFDPPTFGHMDLVSRAAQVVDQLVLGIGVNVDKQSWLAVEERIGLLKELVPAGVDVVSFSGLAVEAARAAGARVLVRGVRSEADMASELQMVLANRRLAPDIETIVLVGSPEVAHISSRLVQEVHASDGDVGLFVPPLVAAALERRRAGQAPPRSDA
jgi:pantetheine-phosphate adenylyltransferase